MKRSEFRALIREEIKRVIAEQRTQRPMHRRMKRIVKEAMDPDDKKYLVQDLQYIYDEASKGIDMTDNIIDELGDAYDAVYDSNDNALIKAYDEIRSSYSNDPKVQAAAAKKLLKVLGVTV